MRLLVLTRYARKGASSRVRFLQYLPYLHSCGWNIDISPLFENAYLDKLYAGERSLGPIVSGYLQRLATLLTTRRFDLIWIEKELFPFLPAFGERILRGLRVPYVVDYDDALFHRYDCHRNAIVRWLLGRKIDVVMRNATLVVAGNGYLAERAMSAGARRIETVPSIVDASQYQVRDGAVGASVTIGWIGSPATSNYLHEIGPALAQIQRSHDIRVRLIGSGPVRLEGVHSDVVGWQESSETELLASLDIGTMPLPDEPWERGKCGYKLIQYMACGIPVVASPVGVNREIVRSGENGFLAGTVSEWIDALDVLAKDPDRRRRMGAAGRARVESEYSLQVQAPRLERILRSVLD